LFPYTTLFRSWSVRPWWAFGASLIPSCLTNVSYVSRRDYLAAPAPTARSAGDDGLSRWRCALAIPISHPFRMSATCPTRPPWGDVSRDGMIGMALYQGLFDRDGRV